MNLDKKMSVFETPDQVFTDAGEFLQKKSIALLRNIIIQITNAFPGNTLQVRGLLLELLRCGIYVTHPIIEQILKKMVQDGAVTFTKYDNPN